MRHAQPHRRGRGAVPHVFRRRTLLAAGGYDPHFTRAQDWELNHRLRLAGGVVWFTPQLRVTYRPRSTLIALARQYRQYGRWRRVVASRHAGTINPRYLAPPAMVVGASAATVAGLLEPRARGWLAVPATYLLAVVVGGWAASRGEQPRTRALLPVVLATMHWSWGLGFLTSPKRLRDIPERAVSRAGADTDTDTDTGSGSGSDAEPTG